MDNVFGTNPFNSVDFRSPVKKDGKVISIIVNEKLEEISNISFKLLVYIINLEKDNIVKLDIDEIFEFMDSNNIKALPTFDKALRELINSRFIAYTNIKRVYWVNKYRYVYVD